ncbi:MAG: adenylate kinase, partial [Thermomicrobiales bacterium]|nr:adenylate kinase [Thermomicrobiales bacterium]
SGKGTQAERLAPRLRLMPIATGNLFREAVKAGTPLGREAKAIMDRGELAPDGITIALVEEKLDELAAQQALGEGARGALFDGFPRTIAQAEALETALARRGQRVDAVVVIDVPRQQLIERLAGRRVCASCGLVYHVAFNPPKRVGICDVCGGELVQRADDTPEAVARRLDTYDAVTAPLLDFYAQRGVLTHVDGDRPIEEVTEAIAAAADRAVADGQRAG